MIRLATPELTVHCHPGHGMLLSALVPTRAGVNLLWLRDAPPLHDFAGLPAPGGPDLFDRDVFAGGWFVMSPNAGIPGADDAGQLMHGVAPRAPWTVRERSDTQVIAELDCGDGSIAVRSVSLEGPAVTVRTRLINAGDSPLTVSFGEHPCLDRSVFAGGEVRLTATDGRVLPELSEPGANRYAPGQRLRWPSAHRSGGGQESAARIPVAPDGRHDHLSLDLASPEIVVTAPLLGGALRFAVDLAATPHLLLWQHFRPPASPWAGDTFGVETMSGPGRTRDDLRAANALRTLAPGAELSWSLSATWEASGAHPPS